MFNIPLEKITIQIIEDYLNSGAKEGTRLDFKEEFPGKLEKTISAMANTYGGMILIGVEETKTGGGVVPVRGVPLKHGLREQVVQKGIDAIHPPLIPEVAVIEFKSDAALPEPDRAVVVIRVDESDEGHAVDNGTTIYVRADNVSDRMRKATVEEVEWFFQKRQKSLSLKNTAINQANVHAQHFLAKLKHRYQMPTSMQEGRFVIWTVPTFPRGPIASPKELLRITPYAVQTGLTIAPNTFPYGFPRPVRDGVSWAHEESSDYYYTEINQIGLVYSEFEFWWDRQINAKVFLPHAGAKLLHAAVNFSQDLYAKCGFLGSFDVNMKIAGVKDRILQSAQAIASTAPRVMDDLLEGGYKINTEATNEEVLEGCKGLMRDIYWAFGRDVKEDVLSADFK